jgi:putative chitinase
MILTKQQITDIISPTRYDDAKLQQITDALNDTFARYNIDSELRICHFLAQVLHESAAFFYSAEIWANTEAQKRYDTRTDLGNTPEADGDGLIYRGRGWIQLTGKANYIAAGEDLQQDFKNNPDLVAKYPWVAVVSGWYWNKHNLNDLADKDDIMSITKIVNGGYNGIDSRKRWLGKSKSFIITPKPHEGMISGKVTASILNIREKPSAQAEIVSNPLPQDTIVTILEDTDGWYRVKTEIVGWVNKNYIQINN